jgi:outer membrane protein insertion porin family
MPTSGSFLRIINELALAGKVASFTSPPRSSSSSAAVSGMKEGGNALGEGKVAFWEDGGRGEEGVGVDERIGECSYAVYLCEFGQPATEKTQTLSLTARAGLLHLLAGDPSTTHYSDKFQLGGPLSVRAFGVGGMGGHEGGELFRGFQCQPSKRRGRRRRH